MSRQFYRIVTGIITAALVFLVFEAVVLRWLQFRQSAVGDLKLTWRQEWNVFALSIEKPALLVAAVLVASAGLAVWMERKRK